ncbi:MAG: YraN family protein [Treponema sp.]|nr:YraN family protein [Treponema sp.]
MSKKDTGNCGEKRACDFLVNKGYEILFQNWRTRTGEIDIITKKDDSIVFVEVKTLPNGTNDMLSRELNYNKQQKIIKTSKRFLLNHRQYNNSYIRFDVIVIDMPGYPEVYHIENAFTEFL